jgi:putative alpha-1,2-mannosidase
MKNLIVIFMSCFIQGLNAQQNVAELVNTFVRTANAANTYPGGVPPWGMVSVSPNNYLGCVTGYIYGKPKIYGFGHVHLSGTGCYDLGNIVLMPTTGIVTPDQEMSKSTYNNEIASRGYYK